MVIFGTDIKSDWSIGANGDFVLVNEEDNARQAIINRLLIPLDELRELGYDNYGNQSFEVIGETDIEAAKAKIKIYTRNCLLKEPRVEEILDISVAFLDNVLTTDISLKMIDSDKPENLLIRYE